jgi:hypothetical protein
LLEEPGLVAAGFEGRDPGVLVGEDGGECVDERLLNKYTKSCIFLSWR